MKKRKKKLPWSKHKSIDKRFLDLRFNGLEDAINLMGNKDKKQHVYGGTGFRVRKNKPVTDEDIYQSNEEFQDSYNNYPQGATNNAKRMLDWREKYGRDVVKGGTEVGWKRANQFANRESLSIDTIKRVNSFLARHEDNAKISEEYRNEPWKDRGYVAYNLWGGKSMVAWAKRISERDDS